MPNIYLKYLFLLLALNCNAVVVHAQSSKVSVISNDGWSGNSVNTVIFRKNALVTFERTQYAAYYDTAQYVVLAKRKLGAAKWQLQRTPYKGDATDAHKSISIMADGKGYLHVAWGQHNDPLNYAIAEQPGSLSLGPKQSMTGNKEGKLSYPEFYRLANGNLLFVYRDGGSGNGDMIMNRYDTRTRHWVRLQDDLINGEGKRNAYWQMAVDKAGTIHLSWVWRGSPDVASNHDMAYACSKDGGRTWQRTTGQVYQLPITAANAEYACRIPQKSELINQTSMVADADGHPYIATYWRDSAQAVPQYHLIYHDGYKWHTSNLSFRRTAFSLSGSGTKRIPISRPQIIAWKDVGRTAAALFFRDEELGSKVSVAVCRDLQRPEWRIEHLFDRSVGSWEPTLDTELWERQHTVDLFVQPTTQVDGEGLAKAEPQPVMVLEWKIK